jgi:hypothetical protein
MQHSLLESSASELYTNINHLKKHQQKPHENANNFFLFQISPQIYNRTLGLPCYIQKMDLAGFAWQCRYAVPITIQTIASFYTVVIILYLCVRMLNHAQRSASRRTIEMEKKLLYSLCAQVTETLGFNLMI